jgi:type III secretion protein Q
MWHLRKVDARVHALQRMAQYWQLKGWQANLEPLPRTGQWLFVEEVNQRWQGWLQPRVWLEQVAPELAQLASVAKVDNCAVAWMRTLETPLQWPMDELNGSRVRIGEIRHGDSLPEMTMLRVSPEQSPVWLSKAPDIAEEMPEVLERLTWPLDFSLGRSSLSYVRLNEVKQGDILLFQTTERLVYCYGIRLGHYQQNEGGIKMEWHNEEQSMAQETPMAVMQESQPLPDVRQLPVNLEFVLHRHQVTLAQLQALCGGQQLVSLPANVEQRVEVRANGALLGIGELVQLEGQLGVEVSQWLGGGSSYVE